jgi:hypothetical protein
VIAGGVGIGTGVEQPAHGGAHPGGPFGLQGRQAGEARVSDAYQVSCKARVWVLVNCEIAPAIHFNGRPHMRRAAWITVVGILGLAVVGSSAWASAATVKGRTERRFTETLVGAQISTAGGRFENVYRIKRSPDLGGAMIQDGELGGSTYPVTGTDSTISFFRDGDRTTRDTFTLNAPNTAGVGTITGRGTCTNGTNFHKFETCTFTFTGTYDLFTHVSKITMTGTDTRKSSAPWHG